MSLDREMRTTLNREAERQAAPPPDVAGLIRGGRVRRRRRAATRIGVAAVATVLVGATVLGVVDADPRARGDLASPPSVPPRADAPALSTDGRKVLEPGTYRMVVGRGPSGVAVTAEVTFDGPFWKQGDYPVVSDEHAATYAGVGVYRPRTLAAGNGCEDDLTAVVREETPAGLAALLADLPRSTVLREPEQASVLGLRAVHLRLRVDVECPGYYRVAEAARGHRGITFGPTGAATADVVIDFWVVEVDGVPVVIDQWRNVDAPPDVVARAHAARESITFVGAD